MNLSLEQVFAKKKKTPWLGKVTKWLRELSHLSNSTLYPFSTSEDTEDEDTGTSSDDDTDSETFQYTSSQSSCSEFTHELPSIYKIWYVSDTIQTLTEGRDSGCDIVLHNDVDALCNSEFDASGVGPPSYRTVENSETSSSSSHSSV